MRTDRELTDPVPLGPVMELPEVWGGNDQMGKVDPAGPIEYGPTPWIDPRYLRKVRLEAVLRRRTGRPLGARRVARRRDVRSATRRSHRRSRSPARSDGDPEPLALDLSPRGEAAA